MSTTPFVSYPLLWTTRYHRLRSRDQEIIMTLVVLFQYFQFSLEKHRFDLKNMYNYLKNFYILLLNYILHVLHELLFFLSSCCFQNHNARKPNEVLHGKMLLKFIEFNIIYFSISSQKKCKIILRIFSLSIICLFLNAGKTVNKIYDNFYLVDIYISIFINSQTF